jgi:AraC-like DNA-binding protein
MANMIVFLFILPISYYGITYTTVFAQISTFDAEDEDGLLDAFAGKPFLKDKAPEAKELIAFEKAVTIYQELLILMETKKPYLDEDLMLEHLAKELNQHSKYLSYVINAQAKMTFFDFINHFRVQEFNRKVLEPKNRQLTFLSIAFDCGFGSKSSFNRAYKNEMGISPTEFIKRGKS